jgi:serine/threonine protein phosphatase PrpC
LNYYSYTSIGSRTINQDCCYPAELRADTKLFIVCDGVGGKPYGDVASKLACSTISDFFIKNPCDTVSAEYIESLGRNVKKAFAETEAKYPETKDTSTTIVLLAFDSEGAIVGWMGDSRLYHISDGSFAYVTQDHSLAGDMLRKGLAEQHEISNIRHIINRSMSAETDDSFDFHRIKSSEIKAGDYFFLCTDGVLENIKDSLLLDILNSDRSFKEKATDMIAYCDQKTKDNFTFQLIEI